MHKETDMDNYNNFDTDNTVFIDGSDDPFGINDVMIKMFELLDERYNLFSESDTDAPVMIDFTAFSEEEMSEFIREAVACVDFENKCCDYDWNRTSDLSYLS